MCGATLCSAVGWDVELRLARPASSSAQLSQLPHSTLPFPTPIARTAPQRVALAKTKSDAVAKADGTFRERPKAERQAGQKHKAAAGVQWVGLGVGLD